MKSIPIICVLSLLAATACSDDGSAPATNNAVNEPGTGTTSGDIVEVASANASFKTLVAAVQAAGLVDTLKGAGPFTVFAPTDAAFAALPAGTVDDLLKPANKTKLVDILTYHVVPGNVSSADVVKLTEATTVEGKKVMITVSGGTVKINDATVTTVDVEASNGVIHVLDKVLLPPAM